MKLKKGQPIINHNELYLNNTKNYDESKDQMGTCTIHFIMKLSVQNNLVHYYYECKCIHTRNQVNEKGKSISKKVK